MKAKLITYSLVNLSIPQQNQFRKRVNGHNDTSHGGRYKYRRKGLLDDITHIKPSRNTLIVPVKESKEIIAILKDYKADFQSYNIEIGRHYFEN